MALDDVETCQILLPQHMVPYKSRNEVSKCVGRLNQFFKTRMHG